MRTLVTILFWVAFSIISVAQDSVISGPITVEWGRGHRCTGRAICSTSAAVGDYANARLFMTGDSQPLYILVDGARLSKTEKAFLFTPMSIELDKPSDLSIGGKVTRLLPGRYPIEEVDGDYKIKLKVDSLSH